jgi:hypothetical protein
VNATPDQAWSVIADAPGRPRWLPELDEVKAPHRTLQQGDRFTAHSTVFRQRWDGASLVTEADEGTSLAEEIHLGIRLTSRWTVTPAAGGSEVEHSLEVALPEGWLGVPLGWLLNLYLSRLQRRSLRALAQVASQS